MENRLLNLEEACKYCGRNEQTMRKAIHKKEIPCKLFRGGYLFSKLALDLWVLGLSAEKIEDNVKNSVTKELLMQVIQQTILTN